MNGFHTNGYSNGLTNGYASVGIGYDEVAKTAAFLLKKTGARPQIGIICGSGLGGLSEMVEDAIVVPYADIPNFARSTAPGHKGQLVFGKLGGKSVVCMQGRIHMYEGYHISKVVYPVRVMKLLGVEVLIATNAAGGLNPNFKVGDIMVMKDHISLPGLSGLNALIGPHDERFGPRFPALSKTYDKELIKLCKKTAKDLKYEFLREGVYLVQSGPCFETIAECRLFQHMGADVTGMSTVPEVSVATQMGMKCFALSLVTNMCIMDYDSEEIANSDEVLEVGQMRGKDMSTLISAMVERIELKGL